MLLDVLATATAEKNDNQLKTKSCSRRSGNNSGRGDGRYGTCGGGNGVDVSSGC
jgi:hypothetical protein